MIIGSPAGHISKTLITGGIKAVKDSFLSEKPDELTRNGGLYNVDAFSKKHLEDTLAVIAIGGEFKTDPTYPSHTISQMALWAIRKQKKNELPITITLNLTPGLLFNEIDSKEVYTEKEQRDRIIKDIICLGATKEELKRLKFELSTQNPLYLELVGDIKNENYENFPIYKELVEAFEIGGDFTKDINRCIPGRAKNDKAFHYALIEIFQIMEDFKKGLRIKIGFKREKLYDQIFINILNSKYAELSKLSDSLGHNKSNKEDPTEEVFGSVYWDERADENSKRLKLKNSSITALKQIALSTPFIIGLILGSGHYYKLKQTAKEHTKITSSVGIALKDVPMSLSLESTISDINLVDQKEKAKHAMFFAKDAINDFGFRYNIKDEKFLKTVYQLFLNSIPKSGIVRHQQLSGAYKTKKIKDFVDDFVEKNETFFKINGIDTIPYPQYRYLEQEFKDTIKASGTGDEKEIMSVLDKAADYKIKTHNNPAKQDMNISDGRVVTEAGDYTDSSGNTGKLIVLKDTIYSNVNAILTEKRHNYIYFSDDHYLLGSKIGKKVSYDYFLQTRRNTRLIFEAMRHIYFSTWYMDFSQQDALQQFIVDDYIENEKKYEELINKKGLNDFVMNDFHSNNKKKLASLGLRLGTPYKRISEHIGAVSNSNKYSGTTKTFNTNEYEALGQFLSKNGTVYSIGIAKYLGKMHMVYQVMGSNDDIYRLDNQSGQILAQEILTTLKSSS